MFVITGRRRAADSEAADDGQHWKRQPSASFNGLRTRRRRVSAANCKCQGRLISSLQPAAEQKVAGALTLYASVLSGAATPTRNSRQQGVASQPLSAAVPAFC